MSLGDRASRSPRVRKRFAVQYGPGYPLRANGFTMNLSANGLAISTSSIHKPGTRLYLELRVVDAICRLEGHVVWARRGLATLGLPNLLGLAITGADEAFFRLFSGRDERPAEAPAIPPAGHEVLVPAPPRDLTARLARFGIEVPFRFGVNGSLGRAGVLQSVSATGLAFHASEPVASGTRLFFAADLEPPRPARGEGHIVWQRATGTGHEHGLKLSQVDEDWYRFVLARTR